MTSEEILLSGIGTVTSGLVVVAKILWKRSEGCESDRKELRKEIEILKTEKGQADGFLEAVSGCDKQGCIFTEKAQSKWKTAAKVLAVVLLLLLPWLTLSCAEAIPLKVGVCKDDVCLNVETQIPARHSGKEVSPVQ